MAYFLGCDVAKSKLDVSLVGNCSLNCCMVNFILPVYQPVNMVSRYNCQIFDKYGNAHVVEEYSLLKKSFSSSTIRKEAEPLAHAMI
jgi:hypothetical protein